MQWTPLATDALLPSGDLGSQMSNAMSPLYMNASQPNLLLNLQNNNDGIETYASMIGLHSKNLFGTCLGVWLILVAAHHRPICHCLGHRLLL